ncbi:MAG: Na/Pi cotransporter family protein [Bdellovibrionaceae bacterium]|nr:Na/Pi cotransporter family protein [Pseudobdellovibrionaceae bacterium]
MVELTSSPLILLFGGVALFIYGMTLASQSLEKLFASRITFLLKKLSANQFLSVIVGISMTTVLQSSGAVTSLLVGLGSARVITLRQVMGVIIGTAIGSTLTVQIISFPLSQFSLPILIVAFSCYFFAKKPQIKNAALVLFGFGLLFLGMGLISGSAKILAELPETQSVIARLRDHPYISIFFAMCFCALVQSSAVTIGLAMSLAQAGAIDLHQAMFWVYGANIGTTSIALLAAVGGNSIAKQVAWAHFFYKTLSVVIFLIPGVNTALVGMLAEFHTSVFRQVANGHLLFNLISAAIFFPLINKGSAIIEKMFPKDPKEEFGTEFLTMNNYESSALAVSYAHREIQRTADIVVSMIEDSVKLFEKEDPELLRSIKERDNQVDFLYREIKMFLLDHVNKSQVAVHQNLMGMIMFLSDLERAADSIDINVTTLAVKKHALHLEFSNEGWTEIRDMHARVLKVVRLGISAFYQRDLTETAIQEKRDLAKYEFTLKEEHIKRLNRGMRESINTSSIHLDLMSEYKRIASLICTHAYTSGGNN